MRTRLHEIDPYPYYTFAKGWRGNFQRFCLRWNFLGEQDRFNKAVFRKMKDLFPVSLQKFIIINEIFNEKGLADLKHFEHLLLEEKPIQLIEFKTNAYRRYIDAGYPESLIEETCMGFSTRCPKCNRLNGQIPIFDKNLTPVVLVRCPCCCIYLSVKSFIN